jgi:hypothetical protein
MFVLLLAYFCEIISKVAILGFSIRKMIRVAALATSATSIIGYLSLKTHSEGTILSHKSTQAESSFALSDLEIWRRFDLLRPDVASRTRPARVEKFLSKEDIEDLERVIEEGKRNNLPMVERDRLGRRVDFGGDKKGVTWRTTYLHSSNFARDRMSSLLNKVLNTAKEIDRKSEWNVLTNRSVLNFRTVEYHDYTEKGGAFKLA